MMNIDGIGEEIAEQLFACGLVENIADIYDLTEEKLVQLDRFGDKSAQRILKGIEDSRQVPFERVVYALSIPFVGETVAKKVAYGVKDMDTLMNMDAVQLAEIDEIGPKIAESIVEYFSNAYNREIIERLRKAGLQMRIVEDNSIKRSDKLSGKSIVISGVFNHHSRDEYKNIIEANGGKTQEAFLPKLTLFLPEKTWDRQNSKKQRNLIFQLSMKMNFYQ